MIASVASRTTVVPTATAGPGLYATAAVMPRILEIGIFNTTTTAMAVGLARTTTNGTPGTALTEVSETDTSQTPVATAFSTQGAAQTMGATFRQASLGAAVGSGVIWTFSDQGLYIPAVANNGVLIICPSGTGQQIDFYIVWRE